ncbi:MAG: redox-sensing transcriptional repressor Rex [Acidobacteria bacterium]|nr:redox-sensing transcriptional repressor Rex [Acidobacteriota bacterium]
MSDIERARTAGDHVSELTTARLSVYLRCLDALDAAGVNTVSSLGLASQFQLNAPQIRKDLAHFGEFGIRGVGYYVKDLKRHLRQILGLDRSIKVVIVGAGNLGLALADYAGFRKDGFDVVALLDTARDKVGQYSRSGVPIRHARDLERLVERERIDIAVICVPGEAAQGSVDAVVAAGVRAILNFSAGNLRVPPQVKLKDMDLTVTFESLSFFLANGHLDV